MSEYFRCYYNETVQVYDFDKCIKALQCREKDNEERIERLQKEINYLVSERYKDKELQRMQEEVRRIRADSARGFPISEKESENISNWIRSHNCPDANCKCGSQLTYTFSPTSIGTFGEVQCSCGAKFEFRKVVWPLRKSCG